MKEERLRKQARQDRQDAKAQFDETFALAEDDEKIGGKVKKKDSGPDGLITSSGRLNNSLSMQLEAKL